MKFQLLHRYDFSDLNIFNFEMLKDKSKIKTETNIEIFKCIDQGIALLNDYIDFDSKIVSSLNKVSTMTFFESLDKHTVGAQVLFENFDDFNKWRIDNHDTILPYRIIQREVEYHILGTSVTVLEDQSDNFSFLGYDDYISYFETFQQIRLSNG